jgi:manganese efflux pump family protein
MNIFTIFMIAFGLAMDAFAVAVASGYAIRQMNLGHAFRMAFFFGGFQAIMPIAGWFLGSGVRHLISGFDHWIAFGLLAFVGGKMIWEARHEEEFVEKTPLGIATLFVLAVATSIDALAVGLTLSFLAVPILLPAAIIGIVTFGLSLAGVYIGKAFGHFFEKNIEIFGGLVLIGIGVKILVEHIF